MMRSKKTKHAMRVFVYAGHGLGSYLLESLYAAGYPIAGVTSAPKPAWKERFAEQHPGLRAVYRALKKQSGVFYRCGTALHRVHPQVFSELIESPWAASEWVQSPEAIQELTELKPDLAIVCGFDRMIPEALLNIPAEGTLNLHPSYLPDHRGKTPLRWAIQCGQSQTGISAHRLFEEGWSGEILSQETVPINDSETEGSLERKIERPMIQMVLKLLHGLESGKGLQANTRVETKGSFEPEFTRSDSVLHWQEGGQACQQRMLAAQPNWGGIFGLRDQLLCAWRCAIINVDPQAAPGTIIEIEARSHLDIAAGKQVFRVKQLLSENGCLTSIPEKIRGSRLLSGEVCMPATQVIENLRAL